MLLSKARVNSPHKMIQKPHAVEVQRGPWPIFDEASRKAVDEVLRSGKVNYWTGDKGRQFESQFADFAQTKYAVAMSNGTVTLEAALRCLGIGPGDEVIVPPRTFLATASAVLMVGATPIFADVELDSGNLSARTIEPLITSKTKSIIPVHLAGWPVEMDDVMTLADEKGLCVIEDCAQAHGAQINGKSVGSFGQIGSWSFCQDKIMTTGGEGGMVTLQDQDLWQRLWSIKDHGKDFDTVYQENPEPGFRWLHHTLGTNWRMTEMQSVIGLEQLKRMPEWHAERTQNAHILATGLADIPGIVVPSVPSHLKHAYYKFYVYLDPHQLASGWDQARILSEMSRLGVKGLSGSCSEIYLEKTITSLGLAPDQRLPQARQLGETSLMFEVHPGIGKDSLDQCINVLGGIMRQARR